MDNYQFVASLVASLAWPVAVVIVAIVFRSPISEMINRLEHVKSPIFEGWAKVAAEAHQAVLATGVAVPPRRDAPDYSLTAQFSDLARVSPPGAVMTAWVEVDKALNAKIQAAGAVPAPSLHMPNWQAALRAGIVDEGGAVALQRLRDLRNLAAHKSDSVDAARALDFLALADSVMWAIDPDWTKKLAASKSR
jgi:hypothetical protein